MWVFLFLCIVAICKLLDMLGDCFVLFSLSFGGVCLSGEGELDWFVHLFVSLFAGGDGVLLVSQEWSYYFSN